MAPLCKYLILGFHVCRIFMRADGKKTNRTSLHLRANHMFLLLFICPAEAMCVRLLLNSLQDAAINKTKPNLISGTWRYAS